MDSHPSPFRSPGFAAFYCAQLSSALNDNLFKNALMIWIAATSASAFGVSPAAMMGLVSALFIAPFFLLSASAGQLCDRFDKVRVIRAVKAAEVLIMALAAYAFTSGWLVGLLIALALMGIHSAVLGPAKYGILPELVGAAELVQANALVEMGTFLAILAGTIAGGVLVLFDGGPRWIAASALAVAVFGVLAAWRIPPRGPADAQLRVSKNPWTPLVQILRITARTRAVFLSVLGISWFWLLGVVMLAYLPTYVKVTLGAQENAVTVLLTLFCVGIALGSLLTERVSGKNLELGLVPFGSIGMTLCLLDLSFIEVPAPPAAALSVRELFAETHALHVAADLFFLAVFGGFFTVPLYTLIQQRTEARERSRVVAGNNVLNALFMVAGSLLLSLLAHYEAGSRAVFAALAVLSSAAAVYIYSLVPEFLLRFLAFILSRTMYRLEVNGHDHIPEHGPVVLVCNHVAFNDWMIVAGSVRRPARFVMDHRNASIPLLATLLRHGKVIPIAPEHENKALLEQAFVRIAEELRAGEVVCIYPEGKITKTGEMNVFKSGVERILRETPVPVVPMAVHGLWGSFFSRQGGPAMQKLPRRFRARLWLEIGRPIAPAEASAASLQAEVERLLAQAKGRA